MKNLIKRYIPTEDYIKNHPQLKFLSKYFRHRELWHMTEKSISHALFIGLFAAVIPIPGQMLLAVILGVLFRANLLLAVALVWISNPLTMGPIGLAAYYLGRGVLHTPPISFSNLAMFLKDIHLIWEPFLLGSLLLGLSLGLIGYLVSRILWRFLVPLDSDKNADKKK
jgi:uncharacterized protein (DUF2062 family)